MQVSISIYPRCRLLFFKIVFSFFTTSSTSLTVIAVDNWEASPNAELLQIIDVIKASLEGFHCELLLQIAELQEYLDGKFDAVIENQEEIQDYLVDKLGSDFEKIRPL